MVVEEAASAAPLRAGGGCHKTQTETLRQRETESLKKRKAACIKNQEHALFKNNITLIAKYYKSGLSGDSVCIKQKALGYKIKNTTLT